MNFNYKRKLSNNKFNKKNNINSINNKLNNLISNDNIKILLKDNDNVSYNKITTKKIITDNIFLNKGIFKNLIPLNKDCNIGDDNNLTNKLYCNYGFINELKINKLLDMSNNVINLNNIMEKNNVKNIEEDPSVSSVSDNVENVENIENLSSIIIDNKLQKTLIPAKTMVSLGTASKKFNKLHVKENNCVKLNVEKIYLNEVYNKKGDIIDLTNKDLNKKINEMEKLIEILTNRIDILQKNTEV
tara:strand:+ start:1689 stop:2420 length:732 start_codon:yes stop_codon:yes gene_type:complete